MGLILPGDLSEEVRSQFDTMLGELTAFQEASTAPLQEATPREATEAPREATEAMEVEEEGGNRKISQGIISGQSLHACFSLLVTEDLAGY